MNPTGYLGRGADGNRNRVSKSDGPLHPSIEGVAIRISIRGILEKGALEESGHTGIEATVTRKDVPADPSFELLSYIRSGQSGRILYPSGSEGIEGTLQPNPSVAQSGFQSLGGSDGTPNFR